jgi:hypothetical protein
MDVNPFLYKIVETLFCFGARAYVLKQIIMSVGSRGFGRVGYTVITMTCNSTF